MLFKEGISFEGPQQCNYVVRIGYEAHDMYFITVEYHKHYGRIPLLLDQQDVIRIINMLAKLNHRQQVPFKTFVAIVAGCARMAMQHRC